MSEINSKKKRSPNFSNEETRLLIKLACQFQKIIENKKTDNITVGEKNQAWQKVTEYFNASSGICYRNCENLKNRYEALKKNIKKKVTHNKKENHKTGGGVPDYIKIEDYEMSLLEIIQTQVNGLVSEYDSDSVLPKTTLSGKVPDPRTPSRYDGDTVEVEDTELIYEFMMTDEDETVISDVTKKGQGVEETLVEHNYASHTNEATKDTISSGDLKNPWKSWTPKTLRSKKNPLLKTPRRGKAHCEMLNTILEERHNLVKLQIQQITRQEERAKEKHNKEMELLNLEIAIKKKKSIRYDPGLTA